MEAFDQINRNSSSSSEKSAVSKNDSGSDEGEEEEERGNGEVTLRPLTSVSKSVSDPGSVVRFSAKRPMLR